MAAAIRFVNHVDFFGVGMFGRVAHGPFLYLRNRGGIQITILKEGGKRRLPVSIILISPRIIISAAWKSAITPSFSGRMS